ncbi:MAG: tetratricopeptide repeat protein [Rikenellaceae bacterium]|jgi:tetratricopeptide (TPR) repeat protein|nr:tetratricopeptide repeat protein [Rikenellaceae bacterium]
MKKLTMFLLAALTLSSAATAQAFKLDVDGNKKKIASSDADIQNAKKNAKAGTWETRGKVYYNAEIAPIGPLYLGMDPTTATLLLGNPSERRTETTAQGEFNVSVYPHFDLYFANNQLMYWKQKTVIAENGLDVAFEAYTKAAELDPKLAPKVKPEILKLVDQYKQKGNNAYGAGDFADAALNFAKAYDFSISPLVAAPDSMSAFNAGYLYTVSQDYELALKYLDQALALGYYGNEGDLYYYRYVAYYTGLKDMEKAEQSLKDGIQKFPANSQLIGELITFYTNTGQDASQMIPMVEEALQRDPDNHVFYFGLGLIYTRLGDFDKAIESFKKASELDSQDFSSAYNVGLTYLSKADAMLPEINSIPVNEQALYNEKMGEFNALYKEAIPFFEKAHALNSTEPITIELLRSIYFRFRDESPEMMANYEKFNAMM